MREILFRGKDKDDGRWCAGYYMAISDTTYCFKEDYDRHPDNTKHYIVFDKMTDWGLPNKHLKVDVDPATVSQYTGLKDINGKQIFEGDICRFRQWCGGDMCWIGVVRYEHQRFVISGGPNKECRTPFELAMGRFISEDSEVIGNIYDNPELMKGEDNDV